MRISVEFHFNDESEASAVTGVDGNVTDLLLPAVGDVVSHRSADGKLWLGRVTQRMFTYAMPEGPAVDGEVTVTLSLHRQPVH